MLREFRGQSFRIRESRRKVLREVPYVSGENHLALSIQGVREFIQFAMTAFRVSMSLTRAGSLKRPFFASSVAIFITFARIAVEFPRRWA